MSQAITRPAESVTQTFTFDGVNRLKSASSTAGWSRSYGYDQFGNRTASGDLSAPGLTPWAFDTTTNRIAATDPTAPHYDEAGNLD